MSEVKKLTQSIRSCSEFELCYGTIVTLNKIDNAAMRLEERLAEARAEIEGLKRIGRTAVRNATKLSGAELQAAKRLRNSLLPEALESERAANAMLTDEIERKDKLIEQMREALQAALQIP
jgi:regulator of replication initiation timing